jgi:hypothetical protein
MQAVAQTSWHQLSVSEVIELLKTDLSIGLSAAEAESRQGFCTIQNDANKCTLFRKRRGAMHAAMPIYKIKL